MGVPVIFYDAVSGDETELLKILGDLNHARDGRFFRIESARYVYDQSNVLTEIRIGVQPFDGGSNTVVRATGL
jgi:hypothetical protein